MGSEMCIRDSNKSASTRSAAASCTPSTRKTEASASNYGCWVHSGRPFRRRMKALCPLTPPSIMVPVAVVQPKAFRLWGQIPAVRCCLRVGDLAENVRAAKRFRDRMTSLTLLPSTRVWPNSLSSAGTKAAHKVDLMQAWLALGSPPAEQPISALVPLSPRLGRLCTWRRTHSWDRTSRKVLS